MRRGRKDRARAQQAGRSSVTGNTGAWRNVFYLDAKAKYNQNQSQDVLSMRTDNSDTACNADVRRGPRSFRKV